MQVFSEKGFSGASTREIARRARVNPVTLFRTFNSKEQLHTATVDYMVSGLQIHKQVDLLAQRGDPARKFIAGVIKTLVDANFSTPEFHRIIFSAALEKSDVANTAVWQRLLPIMECIQAHISQYIRKGELQKCDPLVAARLIVGAAVSTINFMRFLAARKSAISIKPTSAMPMPTSFMLA